MSTPNNKTYVRSAAHRSGGIRKELLTPMRRIGLSRIKRTPNTIDTLLTGKIITPKKDESAVQEGDNKTPTSTLPKKKTANINVATSISNVATARTPIEEDFNSYEEAGIAAMDEAPKSGKRKLSDSHSKTVSNKIFKTETKLLDDSASDTNQPAMASTNVKPISNLLGTKVRKRNKVVKAIHRNFESKDKAENDILDDHKALKTGTSSKQLLDAIEGIDIKMPLAPEVFGSQVQINLVRCDVQSSKMKTEYKGDKKLQDLGNSKIKNQHINRKDSHSGFKIKNQRTDHKEDLQFEIKNLNQDHIKLRDLGNSEMNRHVDPLVTNPYTNHTLLHDSEDFKIKTQITGPETLQDLEDSNMKKFSAEHKNLQELQYSTIKSHIIQRKDSEGTEIKIQISEPKNVPGSSKVIVQNKLSKQLQVSGALNINNQHTDSNKLQDLADAKSLPYLQVIPDSTMNSQTTIKKGKKRNLNNRLSLKKSMSSTSNFSDSDDEFLLKPKRSSQQVLSEDDAPENMPISSTGHSELLMGLDIDSECEGFVKTEGDLKVLRDQVYQVAMRVYQKEQELSELKQAVIYKKLHDVNDLMSQVEIWKLGSREALNLLLLRLQDNAPMTMLGLLAKLNVPCEMVGYDKEEDCFK